MARQRMTQQERSERTRELLLDATIECLIELGYARTSVNEICNRAGLSRGAQQHHFPGKAELMAAALQHLVAKIAAQSIVAAKQLADDPDRVTKGIDLLWRDFSGTLSTASMELWVAARTDPELREALQPVDRALGRDVVRFYRDHFFPDLTGERSDTLYWLTLAVTRGLALDAMIGGDPTRRAALLDEWKAIATDMAKQRNT